MLKQKLNKKKQALYSVFLVVILGVIGMLIFQNFITPHLKAKKSKEPSTPSESLLGEETERSAETVAAKPDKEVITEEVFREEMRSFFEDERFGELRETIVEKREVKIGRKNPFAE